MDANLKRVLLNMTYYTLIGAMIVIEVFFMISLASASMALWVRVVFYILAIALVVAVVYDIICTCMHRQKYIAGIILYVVSIAVVVFALIVMALNSANGRLLLDISERFFRIILFIFILDALAIAIYCTGEKLITTLADRIKK
jgi:hypothetical protein